MQLKISIIRAIYFYPILILAFIFNLSSDAIAKKSFNAVSSASDYSEDEVSKSRVKKKKNVGAKEKKKTNKNSDSSSDSDSDSEKPKAKNKNNDSGKETLKKTIKSKNFAARKKDESDKKRKKRLSIVSSASDSSEDEANKLCVKTKKKDKAKVKKKTNRNSDSSSDSDSDSDKPKAKNNDSDKKTLNKTKKSKNLTLARYKKDESDKKVKQKQVVVYTQSVNSHKDGIALNLSRKTANMGIASVREVSKKDNYKHNHLLVRGFCRGESAQACSEYFRTAQFPLLNQYKSSENLVVDWVSSGSEFKGASKETGCYHRKSNGHSETQFIADFEALTKKDLGALAKIFTGADEEEVYMCGVELFGTNDMCDKCLGEMMTFVEDQQKGKTGISAYIYDTLGDRFKGEKDDQSRLFVPIYHAMQAYMGATYYAEDESRPYDKLDYSYIGSKRFKPKEPKKFDKTYGTYTLSHRKSILVETGIIYGYIHGVGDKTYVYNPNKCFVEVVE